MRFAAADGLDLAEAIDGSSFCSRRAVMMVEYRRFYIGDALRLKGEDANDLGLGLVLMPLHEASRGVGSGDFNCSIYPSRHDHETIFPLPLLASKVSSGCFKVSWGERP